MSSDNINAIINAPEHQLRVLVQALLTSDDHELRDKVVTTYSKILDPNSESSSDGANKRKANFADDGRATAGTPDDVQSCLRCKTSFLLSRNSGQECRYHPGDLDFYGASEIWQEWEYSEMDMDTMESRRDYPEGFRFACCGGDGDADACKVGDHISRKKA